MIRYSSLILVAVVALATAATIWSAVDDREAALLEDRENRAELRRLCDQLETLVRSLPDGGR